MKDLREVSIAKVIYVHRRDSRKDVYPSNAPTAQKNAPAVRRSPLFHLFKKTVLNTASIFSWLGYGNLLFYFVFIPAGIIWSSQYLSRYHSDGQVHTGVLGGLESAHEGGINGESKSLQTGSVIRDCAACPAIKVIPSGTFIMGSPPNEEGRFADEGPEREVQINGFLLGIYEVTQAEWINIMGKNPSHFNKCGPRCPIESITYDEIKEYLRRLSRLAGKTYRLPTEAEWEYSARAGTKTAFPWGEAFDLSKANNSSIVRSVGQFEPNGFGLYDMHGNVWEFVQDSVSPNYFGASLSGSVPYINELSSSRIVRGGSFGSVNGYLRSAHRGSATTNTIDRYRNIGFRVARDAISEAKSRDEAPSFRRPDRESILSKGKEASASTPKNVAADSSPSTKYVETLMNLIRSNILNLDPEKKLSIDLLLKIENNGAIKSIEIKRGSGDSAWDESILAAVKKIRKFPLDENGRIPAILVDEGLLVTYNGS